MVQIPSLQTLRAFDAAARTQSYSRTAEELGLTHSAISHRIRSLEAITGTRLFERQASRMVLTAAGRRLHAQVRDVLGLLETIFRPSKTKSKRAMMISTFPAMAQWLIPRLPAFRRRNPDIDLRLDLSSHVVELGKGIDAGIRYGSGEWPRTTSQRLAGETLIVVCSPDYMASHPLRQPADLMDATLLRHPWHSWTAWFRAAGIMADEPLEGPEYSDSSLLMSAAIAGEGVALSRSLGVSDAVQTGKLISPFPISIADSNSYFFVTPQGASDPRLDVFKTWLMNELGTPSQALSSAS